MCATAGRRRAPATALMIRLWLLPRSERSCWRAPSRVDGLVEPGAVAFQHLVGAEHQPAAGRAARHAAPSSRPGSRPPRPRVAPSRRAQAFTSASSIAGHRRSRSQRRRRAAACARVALRGGEHELRPGRSCGRGRVRPGSLSAIVRQRSRPPRWRASICMMVAAVSSIERRVTSITGQPCSLHSRRAVATSSLTTVEIDIIGVLVAARACAGGCGGSAPAGRSPW